jgi:hypothetical protein
MPEIDPLRSSLTVSFRASGLKRNLGAVRDCIPQFVGSNLADADLASSYVFSKLAISSVVVHELQWVMLKNFAFLPTTILWALVANASGYEASEEVARVLVTVKPRQFEHVLSEIERQGAAAKYSCRRYADD